MTLIAGIRETTLLRAHPHLHPTELSPRLKQIAFLLGEGLPDPQIAARLGVTEGTVRQGILRIRTMTGLERVQIGAWAFLTMELMERNKMGCPVEQP